jgi:hypothetical protein
LLATDYLPFYYETEEYQVDDVYDMPMRPPRTWGGHLPESLERIIFKALEKNIQKRYSNAGELRIALLQAFPDFGNGDILS